ncbi:ABC transporter permease [Desulfovibrio aerotolerans]|uniref:ABC transporter permease n=1 Tax=Solidesulfovibrio aerotolerans TaxID=295255 RepID=A0A7C9MJQ6_9BACT|nr:ABC transporter permease [Solidesulfovibrio aerotolerans]MYL82313.1 ABC transporter permease [Solidesulfovibrio aerotolerans]
MRHLINIYRLGTKEFYSLWHDKILLVVICWVFTGGIYVIGTATSQELHHAPIAVVDEDASALSVRIIQAFYGPYFQPARVIPLAAVDGELDAGRSIFVLDIPPHFERDVLAGKQPDIQVNIDATCMSQAFIGAVYIQNIIANEVAAFVAWGQQTPQLPIALATRVKFNPNLTSSWFGSVMEIINNITLLSILLVGTALVREREHGTLEHLMVMPLSATEILLAKIWPTSLVILFSVTVSLYGVVRGALGVPLAGSIPLFLFGTLLQFFATACIGIFLGTISRNMPQFGLLMILVILPLQMLSGSISPRESMPVVVQDIMLAAPTTHFVSLAQAILYRGADFSLVWPRFLAIAAIGVVFFGLALALFRRSLAQSR